MQSSQFIGEKKTEMGEMPTHTPRSKGTSNHYLVKIFAFAPGFPFFLLLFSLIMAHLLQTPTHQLIPIPLSLKNKNHTPPFKQNFVRYGWEFWNPIASQFTFKSSESWCVDGFFSLARSEFVRCTVNFSPLVWLAFFSQILFFCSLPSYSFSFWLHTGINWKEFALLWLFVCLQNADVYGIYFGVLITPPTEQSPKTQHTDTRCRQRWLCRLYLPFYVLRTRQ